MKEIFVLFITLSIISFAIYFNSINTKNDIDPESMISSAVTSKFNSGISIKEVGRLSIIELIPHDATVIINKEDLEMIQNQFKNDEFEDASSNSLRHQ